MAEMEKQGSALAGVTLEGNDFASLLKKEFKPKTDEAKEAVERAVRTLAEQALSQTSLISPDVTKSIEAIIAQIDKKLTEQINLILHHADFQKLETAVSRPISKSRAHYWQGRAYEAMGDLASARIRYRVAASWPETFYGQVALARLTAGQELLDSTPLYLRESDAQVPGPRKRAL